jgi:hypothetical protein
MQPELDLGKHSSQTSSLVSDETLFALRTRILPVDRDFRNGGVGLNSPLELLPSLDGAKG